jgi:hypothetical protein
MPNRVRSASLPVRSPLRSEKWAAPQAGAGPVACSSLIGCVGCRSVLAGAQGRKRKAQPIPSGDRRSRHTPAALPAAGVAVAASSQPWSSPHQREPQLHVREDLRKEVATSGAGFRSCQRLEPQTASHRNSRDSIDWRNALARKLPTRCAVNAVAAHRALRAAISSPSLLRLCFILHGQVHSFSYLLPQRLIPRHAAAFKRISNCLKKGISHL